MEDLINMKQLPPLLKSLQHMFPRPQFLGIFKAIFTDPELQKALV